MCDEDLHPLTKDSTNNSSIAAPTVLFTGHEGEVLAVDFSPDGQNLASSSFDKTILIHHVYGEADNWCVLKGHTNAVLEIHWAPDGLRLYSCSADSTLAIWDVENGTRLKKLNGHSSVVNSCHVSRTGTPLIVSGADDGTVKVWDVRARRCVKTFEHLYQFLAVSFDHNTQRVFAGCLDNSIRVYNMVNDKEEMVLNGHKDSITGIDVSSDGSYLLSNGMDQTVRIWDICPYLVSGNSREVAALTGATHNFEKNLLRARWGPQGKLCAAGSADRNVYVWDVNSREVLYKLPGHKGSVNEVCFHPTKSVIASASSDKQVYMGELLG